jgi:hypothetical protein
MESPSAAVNRAQGLNVTWSGGVPETYLIVSGFSSSPSVGGKPGATAGFGCYVKVEAGQFTVPSSVLLALPAGTGSMTLRNTTLPVPFAASGIDIAYALGSVNLSVTPSFQ